MTRVIRILLVLAAFAAQSTALYAQATTGRISGTVVDAQSGLLPGALVTATEVRTSYVRTATTDGQGAYVLVNLPLGTYNVSAELPGFKKEVKTGYALVADGRLTADFALEVGGLNETVRSRSQARRSTRRPVRSRARSTASRCRTWRSTAATTCSSPPSFPAPRS